MQMVKKQMAENTNIKLTTKDVQIINDIVNMIGPDVTEKEAELITVLANKGDVPDAKRLAYSYLYYFLVYILPNPTLILNNTM